MRISQLFVCVLFMTVLTACSGVNTYIPKHAETFTKPETAMSLPASINSEKITTFGAIFDPGLFSELVLVGGIWPAVAMKPDGEIIVGYGIIAPGKDGQLPMNAFGDILIQFVFQVGLDELKGAKFAYFNRDGGWAHTMTGWEITDAKKIDDKEYKPLPYDPEKFDDDIDYRKDFMGKFGMTMVQLDRFWESYYNRYGINFEGNVFEISKGTREWGSYEKRIEALMPRKMSMPGGQIRVTYLDLETFREVATEYTGIAGWERWLKRAGLPLTIGAVASGYGAIAVVGTSLAGTGISAMVDDSWKGYYARAKIIRHELAPYFRLLALTYKDRINYLLTEVNDLRKELDKLKPRKEAENADTRSVVSVNKR